MGASSASRKSPSTWKSVARVLRPARRRRGLQAPRRQLPRARPAPSLRNILRTPVHPRPQCAPQTPRRGGRWGRRSGCVVCTENGPVDAPFASAPDRVSSSAESNFPSEPKPKIEPDPPQRKDPQSTPSERPEIEQPGVGHNLWPLNSAPEGGDSARHLQRPTDYGPSLRT